MARPISDRRGRVLSTSRSRGTRTRPLATLGVSLLTSTAIPRLDSLLKLRVLTSCSSPPVANQAEDTPTFFPQHLGRATRHRSGIHLFSLFTFTLHKHISTSHLTTTSTSTLHDTPDRSRTSSSKLRCGGEVRDARVSNGHPREGGSDVQKQAAEVVVRCVQPIGIATDGAGVSRRRLATAGRAPSSAPGSACRSGCAGSRRVAPLRTQARG
jgi:hypothetical protein